MLIFNNVIRYSRLHFEWVILSISNLHVLAQNISREINR